MQKNKEEQAYKDLMSGFSALAAGDNEYAEKLSERAAKTLTNQPLVKLLQAQISVVTGKSAEAEKYYSELAKIDSSRFIGYRGLISQAIENNELDRALELAEDLLKLNPRSKWINEAVIDLSFRTNNLPMAEKYTHKAYKNGSINNLEAKMNNSIIHYLRARNYYTKGKYDEALFELDASIKNNSQFIPALMLQVQTLIIEGEKNKAIKQIEKFWKKTPYPEMGRSYAGLFDDLPAEKRLAKVKRLAKLNPKALETAVILAQAAIASGEKELGKEYLQKACALKETKSICRLMAQLDDSTDWKNRAETADEDKCWHCPQSGARYAEWQLYSDSGIFNGVVWDYPPLSTKFEAGADKFLLIK